MGSAGPAPNFDLLKKDTNPQTGGTPLNSQDINEAKWTVVERLLQDRPAERHVASKYDWLRNYLSEAQKTAG